MSAKDAILKKAFENGGTVDQILGMLGSIVKEDESKMFGYGFNGKGKLLIAGIGAAGMASAAKGERDRRDMGVSNGIRYATPSIRPYLNQQQGHGGMGDISAGATGDLVFAMHNQRNGGYL